MNKKTFFLFGTFLLVLTLANVSALGFDDESMGTFKAGETITLIQTCENCTYINITSIRLPDSSIVISNQNMTMLSATEYSISFNQTSNLGTYRMSFISDEDGVSKTANTWFEITKNGRDKPSGLVLSLFSILFLALAGYFIFFISYTLMFFVQFTLEEHLRGVVFGLEDVMFNLAGYLVLVAFHFLQIYYVANPTITNITSWVIFIAAFTNIVLPGIAFVLSITIWGGMSVIRWSNEQN